MIASQILRHFLRSSVVLLVCTRLAHATPVFDLSEAVAGPSPGQFQTTLTLTPMQTEVGSMIESIGLDIMGSRVGQRDLTNSEFASIQFETSAAFDGFQDNNFGDSSAFPSRIILDAFAGPNSAPVSINSIAPLAIGTFTIDTADLNLGSQQTFSLNIAGVDDGTGLNTTFLGLASPGQSTVNLIEPNFGPATPGGLRTFQPTSVPEPSALTLIALAIGGGVWRNRRPAGRRGERSNVPSAKRPRGTTLTRLAAIPVILAAATILAPPPGTATAAVLADFTFTGNDYTADASNANTSVPLNLSSSVTPSGLTIGDIQFSSGLNPLAALGFAADDYDDALGFSTDVNNDRGFATTDQTLFFTVDVQSGRTLNLDTLVFDSLKTRGSNETGSRVTHAVFINPAGSPQGGLADDADIVFAQSHDHLGIGQPGAESAGPNFSTGRWTIPTIDLSANAGLTGTQTIAIRTYSSDGDDRDFGIDNLRLTGTVSAVPEPGSLMLMLMLTMFASARQRSLRNRGRRLLHR